MASGYNRLFYGDNLDILCRYIADQSVDLIYLDPPFKSNASYNVLFAEHDGTKAASQLHAFEDTWQWNEESARSYQQTVESGGRVSECLQAFHTFLGQSDMMAYLAMMAPRLVQLRRVMKDTASIWLHCDPTASHYLKMLMDAVFGPDRFRDEIIWQRSTAKGHAFTRFPVAQDSIFYYGKTDHVTWNPPYLPHRTEYVTSHYGSIEPKTGRRYTLGDCLNPNPDRPNLRYEWNGHTRVWRWTREKMQAYHDAGRLVYTRTGTPRYKRYLDEMPGTPITSVWTDIPPINSQAQERLGYQTQKPEALLERIICSSSNEGDVVLDPFCGCGTTIAAAHKLDRHWIGIDITQAAIVVIRQRFRDHFKIDLPCEVIGEPASAADAAVLAETDPYQFQWWALGLVDARPSEQKKGADKGIDGRRYFTDPITGKTDQIIFSVKAGTVTVAHVRDLRGVVDRERAAMGALICMEPPTRPMLAEAAEARFVDTAWGRYPRLQVRSIPELLGGKRLEAPHPLDVTYRQAPTAVLRAAEQQATFELEPDQPPKKRMAKAAALPFGFEQPSKTGRSAKRRR